MNWGAGLVVAGVVAAMVSTMDTYLIVATQSLVSDVMIAKRYHATLSEFETTQEADTQARSCAPPDQA